MAAAPRFGRHTNSIPSATSMLVAVCAVFGALIVAQTATRGKRRRGVIPPAAGIKPNAPIKETSMQGIGSIERRPGVFAYQIDMGSILALVLVVGSALLIIGSLSFGVAVRAGIAPDFYQVIALSPQHSLVIHNGASPTCASTP